MNGTKNTNDLQNSINSVMQASNKEATKELINSEACHEIEGYDLNNGINYHSILASYKTTGFQATNFAKAVNEINRMVIFLYFKNKFIN